jgi:hypothetical protein
MPERNGVNRDPWLTEREPAKELRVSTYVVRLEREAGRLGFARLRRRVFYPLSMIEAYKASITHAPPALADTKPAFQRTAAADHDIAQRARFIAEKYRASQSRKAKR